VHSFVSTIRTALLANVVMLFAVAQAQNLAVAPNCSGAAFKHTVVINVGEGDSLADLKSRAGEQAQLEVVERYCGFTISSEAKISHSAVESDYVRRFLYGMPTTFQILRSRYNDAATKFEMTVLIGVKSMPGRDDPGFRVEAWLDRSVYYVGDTARLTVDLTHAAFLYVFGLSGDAVSQIFPNDLTPENQFPAGRFRIPSEKQPVAFGDDLSRRANRWHESFFVVATKKPLDLSNSGIKQPIGVPLLKGETAGAQKLASVLWESGLRRDELAQTSVSYDLYRKPDQY
jgi:hypothetical protein